MEMPKANCKRETVKSLLNARIPQTEIARISRPFFRSNSDYCRRLYLVKFLLQQFDGACIFITRYDGFLRFQLRTIVQSHALTEDGLSATSLFFHAYRSRTYSKSVEFFPSLVLNPIFRKRDSQVKGRFMFCKLLKHPVWTSEFRSLITR